MYARLYNEGEYITLYIEKGNGIKVCECVYVYKYKGNERVLVMS